MKVLFVFNFNETNFFCYYRKVKFEELQNTPNFSECVFILLQEH